MPAQHIKELLQDYLLARDLEETTEQYYRRVVSVYWKWQQKAAPRADFAPEIVSKFLQDKQREGKSSHYRKSLRNALRALLNHAGQTGPIRTVRLDALHPNAWDAAEVARLVASIDKAIFAKSIAPVAVDRRWFWRTIIPMAWYTGLERMDLCNRFENKSIAPNGIIVTERHKTGKRVVSLIPEDFAAELRKRPPGPLWNFNRSIEYFRKEFKLIVGAAGLTGTFKKLRKSSGTAAEMLHPGRGHEHLANSRAIFEKHYLAVDAIPANPLSPPKLPQTGTE